MATSFKANHSRLASWRGRCQRTRSPSWHWADTICVGWRESGEAPLAQSIGWPGRNGLNTPEQLRRPLRTVGRSLRNRLANTPPRPSRPTHCTWNGGYPQR